MPGAHGERSPSTAFRGRTLVLGRLDLAVVGLRGRPEVVGWKGLGPAASGTRRDGLAAALRAADRDCRGPAATPSPVPTRAPAASSTRLLAAAGSALEPAGRDGRGPTALAAWLWSPAASASAAGSERRSSGSSTALARRPARAGRAEARLAAR
jgi:hypothetical protein